MSEPGSRRGRIHDAEGAREAILNAAEEVFAEHGFDGARIDTIAEKAGYNKSLIFHYYDDKLGLYTAVLKRVEQQSNELQARTLAPLMADESLTSDPNKFRTFLGAIVRLIFDVMVENPRMVRMLAWENAEGWQTTKKIASQFNTDDEKQFIRLLRKAQDAGIMHPGINRNIVFFIAFSSCLSYLTFIPRLAIVSNDEDLSSPEALARAREMIVEFIIHGIMADSADTGP
jgi:TetR/AcrR family transcriptional regulator